MTRKRAGHARAQPTRPLGPRELQAHASAAALLAAHCSQLCAQPRPAGPGLALGLAWLFVRRAWLAGRWPGFVLGLVRQASSDAYSYDALPIKFSDSGIHFRYEQYLIFPIPELISVSNKYLIFPFPELFSDSGNISDSDNISVSGNISDSGNISISDNIFRYVPCFRFRQHLRLG